MLFTLLSTAWEWNWSDFAITVIGSLLGFAFAILSAWGANKWIEKAQRNSIVKLIKKDLTEWGRQDIQNQTLQKIKTGMDIGHKILSLTPVEQLAATNQLILISNEKWFNDLMELFATMNEINKWYEKKSDYYFDNLLKLNTDNDLVNNEEQQTYQALCVTIADETQKQFFAKIPRILNAMQ